jgi:hypothetical protein
MLSKITSEANIVSPIRPKELYALRNNIPFRAGITVAPALCPDCGASMTYKLTTGTYEGMPRVKLVYAQCHAYPHHDDHGYHPHSKYTDPEYKSSKFPDAPPPTFTPEKEEIPDMPATNPLASLTSWLDDRFDKIEKKALDFEKIRALVAEEVSKQPPRVIHLKGEKVDAKLEGVVHPVLPELIERYEAGERTFLLTGPAGTGKTTIALSFSKAIKAKRTTVIGCSEDMRREQFVGFRSLNVADGTAPYVPSALVEDLKVTDAPTVTILEEIDASNPNALLTINALENGMLPTPDCTETPVHARPAQHVLIATANTWGNAGTGSNSYVGRNQLDAATINRYRCLFVGYDPKVEAAVVGCTETLKLTKTIRERLASGNVRRMWTTRNAARVAFDGRLGSLQDLSVKQRAKMCMQNEGWTADDIVKVGL